MGLLLNGTTQFAHYDGAGGLALGTKGTLHIQITPSWDSDDGLSHYIYIAGYGFNEFNVLKYSDDSWYIGFINTFNPNDYRVVIPEADMHLGSGIKHDLTVEWDTTLGGSSYTNVYFDSALIDSAIGTVYFDSGSGGGRALGGTYGLTDMAGGIYGKVVKYDDPIGAVKIGQLVAGVIDPRAIDASCSEYLRFDEGLATDVLPCDLIQDGLIILDGAPVWAESTAPQPVSMFKREYLFDGDLLDSSGNGEDLGLNENSYVAPSYVPGYGIVLAGSVDGNPGELVEGPANSPLLRSYWTIWGWIKTTITKGVVVSQLKFPTYAGFEVCVSPGGAPADGTLSIYVGAWNSSIGTVNDGAWRSFMVRRYVGLGSPAGGTIGIDGEIDSTPTIGRLQAAVGEIQIGWRGDNVPYILQGAIEISRLNIEDRYLSDDEFAAFHAAGPQQDNLDPPVVSYDPGPHQLIVDVPFELAPTTYSAVASATISDVPDGLTFNQVTGVISGTPTGDAFLEWAGPQSLTVTAVNLAGSTESDPFELEVFYQFEYTDATDYGVYTMDYGGNIAPSTRLQLVSAGGQVLIITTV